ncbi:MAG: dihydrolipoyl dehydrogenase family protein [Gaiellaceae bacterium]
MAHDYDLVVVGLGSGGLTAAKFASTLGLRVAGVERDRVGGDCLWTGCVPSKSLLASAKVAQHMRTADEYGIGSVEPAIDLPAVWRRIRGIQAEIGQGEDSPAHLESLGVEVVLGQAELRSPHTVQVGERTLDTKFTLICTGSRPAVPPVPGLAEAGYLTSENIWELEQVPASFVVVGGGPIAVELAQALNRLGTSVQVIEMLPRILAREEQALSRVLTDVLKREGVRIAVGARGESVRREGSTKVVSGSVNGEAADWSAEEIIVAAGRTPNADGLGLEELGIEQTRGGIVTDARGRTAVRSIYATGDVAGGFQFTHWAGYESALTVRDMFFPGKAKFTDVVPWCTFTDPELARVGLTEAEAIERYGGEQVRVDRAGLDESDRARADGATEGAIITVSAKDKLVGAHVLAPSAGELIQELSQAVHEGRSLAELAEFIHVYPTLATSINLLGAARRYEAAKRWTWLIRR